MSADNPTRDQLDRAAMAYEHRRIFGADPVFVAVIPGEPLPKQRPRFANGRAYTPKATHDAETRIRTALCRLDAPKIEGPVHVSMTFYRSTRRAVDVDNLSKLVGDSIQPTVIENDSSIVASYVRKAYDKQAPRTVIAISQDEPF